MAGAGHWRLNWPPVVRPWPITHPRTASFTASMSSPAVWKADATGGVAFSTRCRHSCAAFTEQAASSLSFSFVIFQAAQNKEARPPTEHAVASYIRQDAAWQGGGWTVSGRLGSGKMPSPCREESQSPGAAARPVQHRAVRMGAMGMMLEPQGCWEDHLFSRTIHPQSITVFNSFPFLPNNAHSLKKI